MWYRIDPFDLGVGFLFFAVVDGYHIIESNRFNVDKTYIISFQLILVNFLDF